MTLDELSVVFSADTAPFEAAVSRITQLLRETGGAADGAAAQLHAAGSQAGAGFALGLLSQRAQVISAARSLAAAASAALRSALDIHSPSRVTREMGLLFDEGLRDGMLDGQKGVSHMAQGLGNSALFSLRSALDQAPPLPALGSAAVQNDLDARALSSAAAAETALPQELHDFALK